jgi:hypothetical protein
VAGPSTKPPSYTLTGPQGHTGHSDICPQQQCTWPPRRSCTDTPPCDMPPLYTTHNHIHRRWFRSRVKQGRTPYIQELLDLLQITWTCMFKHIQCLQRPKFKTSSDTRTYTHTQACRSTHTYISTRKRANSSPVVYVNSVNSQNSPKR